MRLPVIARALPGSAWHFRTCVDMSWRRSSAREVHAVGPAQPASFSLPSKRATPSRSRASVARYSPRAVAVKGRADARRDAS